MSSLFDGLEPGAQGSYADVAIAVPLRRTFAYRIPHRLAAILQPGSRVAVPFARRKVAGFVLRRMDEPPKNIRVLDIADLIEREPVFPAEILGFLLAAADYYMYPVGEVLRAASPALAPGAIHSLRQSGFLEAAETLPGRHFAVRTEVFVRALDAPAPTPPLGPRQQRLLAALRGNAAIRLSDLAAALANPLAVARRLEGRGLVEISEREVVADPFFAAGVEPDTPPQLSQAQEGAAEAIGAAVRSRTGGRFLLHGATGSGKTEVYMRAIGAARESRGGAIVLVPEIALTPQLVARFRARFGSDIAVLHSGLGNRERYEAWRALRTGAIQLAIGARSALFAPVHDLAIIVVDEEHDPSFKQEEGFRYHARDLALLRAHRTNAVCVLGSATPSIETYHAACEGRLQLLAMPERVTRQQLPTVEIVDLARHQQGPSGHRLLSMPLYRAIEETLARKEQTILFLNRRGFAPSVRCADCGAIATCPACSVGLTEHRRAGVLRCHYCDFATPPGEACTACGAEALERIGLGTERLEDTLGQLFPSARIARLDRDTAGGSGVETILATLRSGEVDILVGTQMVTKGHDLPGVTLVGVLIADQPLAFPDFRASERTFQLLAQVAGRAGRGDQPGRVIFQAFQPHHAAIQRAASHDYQRFYADEIEDRRELGYVPFARLVALRVDAVDDNSARRTAELLASSARRAAESLDLEVRVLGPAPAPIARVRGRYRYRALLRSSNRRALRRVAATVLARIEDGIAPVRASVDFDPISML